MKLYLQFILRYLRIRRSFSFSAISLATVGLALGVSCLIITISVLKGFEEVLSKKLVNVDGQVRIKTIFGAPIDDTKVLDSIFFSSNLDIVAQPFVRGSAVIYNKKKNEGLLIEGIDSLIDKDLFEIDKNTIDDDEIVIGRSLAENMQIDSSNSIILVPLNSFNQNDKNFKFFKLFYKRTFKTGMDEYDKNLAYVNVKTAQKLFQLDNMISGYIINSTGSTDDLTEILNKHIKYPFFLETWKERHYIIFAWFKTQTLPIIIIFSLIALVGITNVIATISLMVNERTKEIGILLAQGFQKNRLRNIFLIESGCIGLIGSIMGAISASLFIYIQNKYNLVLLPEKVYFMNTLPVSLDLKTCIIVIIVSLIISVFAGFLPSKTVLNKKISILIES